MMSWSNRYLIEGYFSETQEMIDKLTIRLRSCRSEGSGQALSAHPAIPLYSWFNPGHLFMMQDRERQVLNAFKKLGWTNLDQRKILEVGCGAGYWLADFLKWGARPENIIGLDLLVERLALAKERCPGSVGLLSGDAICLAFNDGTFDLVLQSTVFSSILDADIQKVVAAEMLRVLKNEGLILWYDFHVNNPWNPKVHGVTKRAIYELFPHCDISLRRITLAPPIVRLLAPYSFLLCHLLSHIPFLCTHYLGVIRKAH